MYILEILISVTLVIIAVYSSCISIINGVNLCKPIHGNIITVTGLRNYRLRYIRGMYIYLDAVTQSSSYTYCKEGWTNRKSY